MSASVWSWSCDEAVREVRVHGKGLADAKLLHDNKAQAIDCAVGLILVPLEVVEGRSLLVGSGPVNARELLTVELIPKPRSLLVADLAGQRNRLGDDVIRGDQVLHEPQILESTEDFDDARVVGVSLRDEREEESRIEERHTLGCP